MIFDFYEMFQVLNLCLSDKMRIFALISGNEPSRQQFSEFEDHKIWQK